MLSRTTSAIRSILPAVLMILVLVAPAVAQEAGGLPEVASVGQQSLKAYWHVFIAYAIVVVLILGWVVSIARRLRSLERRLVD